MPSHPAGARGSANASAASPPANTTTAVTLIVRNVRSRPSTFPSQRAVSSRASANDTAAPSAHAIPGGLTGLPNTSSASARPTSASGIATTATPRGGPAPVAQENSASRIGNVLNASNASATGINATAEYRQKL